MLFLVLVGRLFADEPTATPESGWMGVNTNGWIGIGSSVGLLALFVVASIACNRRANKQWAEQQMKYRQQHTDAMNASRVKAR